VLHKPLIGEEGVEGIRGGLTKPEVQPPSLDPFVLSFYMMDRSDLCNVFVGDLECVCHD
jgi:hypothetical protein